MQKSHGETDNSAPKKLTCAFSIPQPLLDPLKTTDSTVGALAAASVAGTGRQRIDIGNADRKPFSHAPINSEKLKQVTRNRNNRDEAAPDYEINLNCPNDKALSRQQSPSHIAATLAASKAKATFVNQNPQVGRLPNTGCSSPTALSRNGKYAPATKSLIQYFETKIQVVPQEDPDQSSPYTNPALPNTIPIPLATPVRLSSPKTEWVEKPAAGGDGTNPSRTPPQRSTVLPDVQSGRSQSFSDSEGLAKAHKLLPKMLPSQYGTPSPVVKPSSAESTDIPRPNENETYSNPSRSLVRDSPLQESLPTAAYNELVTHPFRRSLPNPPGFKETSPSPKDVSHFQNVLSGYHSPQLRIASGRFVPQLTADSLADAIVASSLATSRASSPTKTNSSFVSRRQSKQLSSINQNNALDPAVVSRTPSPAKVLRQTMRGPPRSDEDIERVKRNHLLKHPNKHNEGDRKRWRDQVTERERKRYEGVWAANRGHFISESEPAEAVHALIVQDIWSRSQLSSSILAEVWDLVENQGARWLSREKFVVGMWLVDQCLKGRKLPVKVSESVWSSVRRLNGITIPKHPG